MSSKRSGIWTKDIEDRLEAVEKKLSPDKSELECKHGIPRKAHGISICALCVKESISDPPLPPKGAQAGIITAHCETCKCYRPLPESPPLNARVAKALGKKVDAVTGVDGKTYWGTKREGRWEWELFLDYSHDLTLIEQTATRYFNKHNRKWGVCHLRPPDDYYQAFYFVDFEKDRSNFVCGDTAAEALSRLIVYHHERAKGGKRCHRPLNELREKNFSNK